MNATLADPRHETLALLRPQLQVVLEHHHLAVQDEGGEGVVRVQDVEQPVDEVGQAHAEVAARRPPLAVPVGVVVDDDAECRVGSRRIRLRVLLDAGGGGHAPIVDRPSSKAPDAGAEIQARASRPVRSP